MSVSSASVSSLPKIKKITVSTITPEGEQGEKVLTVTKMPLGRYSQFLKKISGVPDSISENVRKLFGETLDKDGQPADTSDPVTDTILQLPVILAKHWPDLISILSIASGVPEKDVADLDFSEGTMLFEAIVEVNDFFGAASRLQQIAARFGRTEILEVAGRIVAETERES